MSRLNNHVVGAQSALTDTFINVLANIVTVVSTPAIMITLEWRLTLLSVMILPLFIIEKPLPLVVDPKKVLPV